MKNTSIHVNHALIVSGMTQVFNMFCHYYLLLPGTCESVQSTTEAFNRDEQAQPQQRSPRWFAWFPSCKAVRLFVKGEGLTMHAFVFVCLFLAFLSSFGLRPNAHACLYGFATASSTAALRSFYRCPLEIMFSGLCSARLHLILLIARGVFRRHTLVSCTPGF